MKKLPIKKELEKHLKPERGYSGVWKDKDKKMYIKLTSKLGCPVVKIDPADYDNHKDALEDTIACAKVYKRFVKEGLYHPDTQVVVCEDDEDNLTSMVTMPELKINKVLSGEILYTEIKLLMDRIGLEPDKYEFKDLRFSFNWGYDKKTKELYSHDLHIAYDTSEILDMAKDLGYKK